MCCAREARINAFVPRRRGRASALPLLRARTTVDAAVDHVATYYEHKARSSTPSYGPAEGGVDRKVAAVLAALRRQSPRDGDETDDALELATMVRSWELAAAAPFVGGAKTVGEKKARLEKKGRRKKMTWGPYVSKWREERE